jgi:hypothetical protein
MDTECLGNLDLLIQNHSMVLQVEQYNFRDHPVYVNNAQVTFIANTRTGSGQLQHMPVPGALFGAGLLTVLVH